MMSEKFILTEDCDAAKSLRSLGFIEIPTITGFLFLNDTDKLVMFENIDANHLVFTNTISL